MGRIALLVVLLGVAAVLMPTAILLSVLLVPSLVAYAVDRTRQKYLAMTVAMPNICGAMPAVVALWERGQSFDGAFAALSDPWNLMTAYVFAAIGWGIHFATPLFVASYLSITTETQTRAIRKHQKALVKAWGEGVMVKEAPPEEESEEEGLEGEQAESMI